MANEVVIGVLQEKIDAERRNVHDLEYHVKYYRREAREAVQKYRKIKRLLSKALEELAALIKAKEDLQ